MFSFGKWFSTLVCLISFCNYQQALYSQNAVQAFKKISPSVVALANEEGSGTGIVLNREGFILTNAHVVASPLPYKCNIEFQEGDKKVWKEYSNVQIVGTHPSLDLAIVKIDPKEHKHELVPATINKRKGEPGETVYAVGNPGSVGKILRKTITSGLLSGVDRDIEGEKYYQIDAAINPGNSGGPLVDKFGKVFGLVTFKSNYEDNVGFVIPLHDFNPKIFNDGSKKDVKKSIQFGRKAGESYSLAADLHRRQGKVTFEVGIHYSESIFYYQRAINYDPQNPNLLYNCGLAFRSLNEYSTAEAYILKSLRLNPWFPEAEHAYRELGLILSKTKRVKDGNIVHQEGIAKYPKLAGKCWEDLAGNAFMSKNYLDSAYNCPVVLQLKVKGTRLNFCNDLFAKCIAELNDEQKDMLRSRIKGMQESLSSIEAKSKQERDAKKTFINKDFDDFLKRQGGLLKFESVDLAKIKFHLDGGDSDKNLRLWTDSTGKFSVSAKLESFDGTTVKLKKKDGSIVSLPVDRLSDTDQTYLLNLNK